MKATFLGFATGLRGSHSNDMEALSWNWDNRRESGKRGFVCGVQRKRKVIRVEWEFDGSGKYRRRRGTQ